MDFIYDRPLLRAQSADISTALTEARRPMSNIMTLYKNRAVTRHRMGESGDILWELGLSGATGALLGIIGDANLGKADLIGGALVGVSTIALPFLAGPRDKVRHVGSTAFGVGLYRQIEHMKTATPSTSGAAHGAERVSAYGSDPIARAAAKL